MMTGMTLHAEKRLCDLQQRSYWVSRADCGNWCTLR